jgi:ATP-dependent DNA helicase RecG
MALLYLREVGAIDNAVYRTLSSLDTLKASARLRHLRDLGLLEQKEKGRAAYYVAAGPLILAALPEAAPQSGMSPSLSDMSSPLSDMSPALCDMPEGLADMLEALPELLKLRVQALGRRTQPEVLRDLVLDLCAWRDLEVQVLVNLLGKSQAHLRERILYPLIGEGRLVYRYPESPRSPRQAYRTAPAARKDGE